MPFFALIKTNVSLSSRVYYKDFIQPIAPFLVQSSVSMGAYTVGLAVSQGIGSALRISCASPVVNTLGGVAGVGFASAIAGQASLICAAAYRKKPNHLQGFLDNMPSPEAKDVGLDMLLGIVAFKVVGGSFRTIMPSDLTKVGAIARESIPAAGMQYAGEEKRKELIRMFRRDGCHHCGTTKGPVIGDHMPPNKHVVQKTEALAVRVVDRMFRNTTFRNVMHTLGIRPLSDIKQRYYPQCVRCSQKQAAAVRNDRSHRVFHRVLHGGGKGTGWHYIGVWVGASHGPLIDQKQASRK